MLMARQQRGRPWGHTDPHLASACRTYPLAWQQVGGLVRCCGRQCCRLVALAGPAACYMVASQ